jgi:hypothetical protein
VSWEGGEPHAPSAFLAGIGKGRFLSTKPVAILERHYGAEWREVARFGSLQDADRALDEAVGSGAPPDSLRVVETNEASNRLLLIAGTIAIAAAIAIVVYVLLG